MVKSTESRIRRLRKERKLSGIRVAELLEITPQYYYDIEKGERRLTSEIAAKLADIFQTTTDYLLGKTDINLYDYILTPEEEAEEIQKSKNPISIVNETGSGYLTELPIEELIKLNLTYKGHKLTDEQKQQLAKIIQAAADMLN